MLGDVVRFFQRFSNYVVVMSKDLFVYFNTPIRDIIYASSFAHNGLVKIVLELVDGLLPTFTLIQFITINVASIIAIVVLKWFKELIA